MVANHRPTSAAFVEVLVAAERRSSPRAISHSTVARAARRGARVAVMKALTSHRMMATNAAVIGELPAAWLTDLGVRNLTTST